jgi:monofunctional biosynthetic peptidoglycan transglycosylase
MKLLTRLLILFVLAFAGLQLFFVLRVGAMAVLNPYSTSFERSQAFQLLQSTGRLRWSQDWRDSAKINDSLKRAVIASEDDGFSSHDGVDWEALEKAWVKNSKAEDRASKRAGKGYRARSTDRDSEIGRASCRERVCQYV